MEIAVTAAKAQLTELVRKAEAGEEVVLTRHGRPTVRMVRVISSDEIARRRQLLDELSRRGAAEATPGPDAAHSADFLYDDDGMPG